MSGHPGDGSPPSRSDLMAERTRLALAYDALQRELRDEQQPSKVVELLRRLSSLRVALVQLDADLSVEAEPSPVIAAAGPPVPPVVPDPPGASESPSPVPDEPVVADGAEPEGPVALVLRFLVEGPAGAGVSTVLDQLAEQFRAHRRVEALDQGVSVDLLEFAAGLFDGLPITFQLVSPIGRPPREVRRLLRSIVDSIVIVIDARAAETGGSLAQVGELLDDCRTGPVDDRPEVTVFANKADLPGALGAEEVAAELLVESSVGVVSTSRDRGYLYPFVQATNAGVRRSQRRDEAGLPRASPLDLRQLQVPTVASVGPSARADVGAPGDALAPDPSVAVATVSEVRQPSRPPLLAGPPPLPPAPSPLPPGPPPGPPRHPPEPGPTGGPGRTDRVRGRSSALRRLISALRGAESDPSDRY